MWLGRRAVVLGAGIGGLLAARVLADYFETVVVFDKDRLADGLRPRKGVPQGPQVHAIFKRGENIIAGLFPRFHRRLAAGGAVSARFGIDLAVFEGGGWHPRRDPGITLSMQTRALLERVVRQCLAERDNVEIRSRCRLREFKLSGHGMVDGVDIDALDGGAGGFIPADLVIDAMGRGSVSPKWLAQARFGDVPVSKVAIAMRYVTLLLNQPPAYAGSPEGWIVRATAPHHTRGATMFAIEGQRWLLTLVSRFGDRPPLDFAGCLEFAKSLEVPEVYERARQASLDSAPKAFNIPHALLSHFDALPRFPGRFLPLGDVVGSFNPIQAQGMTVAALHAEALGGALDRCRTRGGDLAGLAQDYLPAAVAISAEAWQAAALSDFTYPQTKGERPADLDQRLRLRRAVRELIEDDAELHLQAVRVQQMLEPASVLARADVLARAAELA